MRADYFCFLFFLFFLIFFCLGTIQVGILQRRDQRKIKSYQQRKQSSQTELIIRLQQLRTQIIGQGHSMSPTLLLQYFVTALP